MVQQGHDETVEESGQEQNPEEAEKSESARISELEELLAQKDGEITGLKQAGLEMEKKFNKLNDSLAEAIASYKGAVIRANPELIEGLISGESIESINDSLARAKELVSKVRHGVEKEISQARVPAGAPERRPADFSILSPREKIQQAIGKK